MSFRVNRKLNQYWWGGTYYYVRVYYDVLVMEQRVLCLFHKKVFHITDVFVQFMISLFHLKNEVQIHFFTKFSTPDVKAGTWHLTNPHKKNKHAVATTHVTLASSSSWWWKVKFCHFMNLKGEQYSYLYSLEWFSTSIYNINVVYSYEEHMILFLRSLPMVGTRVCLPIGENWRRDGHLE